MIKIGDTITLRNNPSGTEHLFFIIGEHCNRYLLVNVTTLRPNSATSCILNSTDHSFLRHQSVINYGDALDTTEAAIERNINSGISRKLASINETVLNKIKNGALKSNAFPRKFRQYIA